jgi:hypothetical protein
MAFLYPHRRIRLSLLLGFAPLAAFMLLARLSPSLALWIAFAAAFSLGIRAFLERGMLRLFDLVSTALFGLLALYDGFIDPGMRLAWIGMILEVGLLMTVLWSLLRKQPFTRQYASVQTLYDYANTPFFVRTNYAIAAVWAGAFAFMAVMDALTAFVHRLPVNLLDLAGLVAFLGALTFTWYASVAIGRRIGRKAY